MKIALIGQKGIPAKFGGVERHVEELAGEMVKKGHQVFVYARNNYTSKDLNQYNGINLIHLPSIGTKNLDAISHTFLASLHALKSDYDVIHFQAIGPSMLIGFLKLLKRKTLIISTFHCQDYYHKKWGLFARWALRFGEWSCCRLPDRTIVVSDSLDKYSRKKYSIKPKLIYNGTRIRDDFDFKFLQKWKLEPQKYAVFVGRLIRHKGAHILAEAFVQLEKEGKIPSDFKLVIVGDGFYTDDYVKELKDAFSKNEKVIFTGNLEGLELRSVFAGAYVFVQPSEAEGLSITLLEAMAYGVPVLVSDIKENTDVIKDMGFIFKTNDVSDLKEKLKKIFACEADELVQKTVIAKKEIKNKYDWERIGKKTLNLYLREIKIKNRG